MSKPNCKSERSKEAALPILARTPSYAAAAKEIGITEVTLYQWLKDPEFAGKVDALRDEILAASISRLKACAGKAIDTLFRLLEDGSPGIQRGCANDLLTHIIHFRELQLDERVKALEQGASHTILQVVHYDK